MKTQNELIKEFLTLIQENPDARIVYCIDNEETLDSAEYRYSLHEIHRVELDMIMPSMQKEGSILIGEDEIYCELQDCSESFPEDYEEGDTVDDLMDLHAEKVIMVYTKPLYV